MGALENPVLSVAGLRTHYRRPDGSVVRSVDGVDLSVLPGEVVALVGESGCGKSTTALSIMGLIAPPGRIVGGQIRFNGTDLLGLRPAELRQLRGRELAIVFQNPNTYLNPVVRVGDQIAEGAVLHLGAARAQAWRKAVEALEQVKVPDPERVAASYPHELSGGMNQRVLIAIAIVCAPALVILDEPTTALDVMVQREIINLLKDLRTRLGSSMIFITHDLALVAELADRVYVMYAGRVVEHGTVFELFQTPRHPYTRALLDSVLSIAEVKDRLTSIDGSVPDLGAALEGCLFRPRCPRAIARCARDLPAFAAPSPTHGVACWRVP